MESPSLECIISELDIVLDEMERVEGRDFRGLVDKGMDSCEKIGSGIKRLRDSGLENRRSCDYVMTNLEKWNFQLRNLIEKIDRDVEVLHMDTLQSNEMISLSDEEKKFLKVKKEKRIKDLKFKIYKLIIKVDELIMAFDELMEHLSSDLNGDTHNENLDLLDEIEFRYKVAVNGELDNSTMLPDVDKQEEPNENDKEYERNEEYNGNSPINERWNSEVVGLSQINDGNITKDKPTNKEAEESRKVVKIKSWEKDSVKGDRDEFMEPLIWTKFRYSVTNGEFADMDIGCILSSCKDTFSDKDQVMVTAMGIDDIPLNLDPTVEVLSNFIKIEPVGLDVDFDNEYPWKVSIPYLMTRNASKEVVIICYDMTSDTSMALETQEMIFDDNKEGGFKLAEATMPSSSCICVVICKRKIEKFRIDKRGNKFISNIDPRVVLTMLQNSVKINVNFEISVLQIESGHLNELVSKISQSNLYSMSPIVDIRSDYPRNFLKTVTLQIPIPNTPAHSNRGRAVSARPQTTDKMIKRSKSAITRQISTEEDPVIKVGTYNFQENMWRTNNNLNFTINKNKDSVEIDIQNLSKQRFVVVRSDENFHDEHLNRSIDIINKSLETRLIQFVIRQHSAEPSRIVIVATHPNRMDKVQKALTLEQFGEETSLLSPEFTIQERSKLVFACKGNLEMENRKILTYRYNSQLPNRKEFWVKEIDKFAQKSKEFYQGFVLISEMKQNNVHKLWEAVINIPKIDIGFKKETKDINAFDFQATDVINKHYLWFLSHQVGKDWMMLGKYLKVSEVTIRRISNNPSIDGQTMAYECLLKWIKNATVYSNKAIVIEKALRSIGRFDLVQDLAKRILLEK